MKTRTLAEIDEIYAPQPAWVVEAWEAQDTGVDPLGLRQTNLDMMDRVLPGINNVTRHVRVYTVMTWAWWKAARLLSDDGEHGASSAAMRDFVDRVDAVFSWSQFLLEPDASLPGKTVLPKELDTSPGATTAYDFASEKWTKLRTSRRNSTDLLGAVQYGPSVRGAQGLHWLVASDVAGVFVPSTEVAPAVEAFDSLVSPHLPKCLRDPKRTTISLDELKTVGPIWRYTEPSPAESQTFAHLYFGDSARAKKDALLERRRSTLKLVLSTMGNIGEPCNVQSLRAAMFSMNKADEDIVQSKSRHAWRVLQIRQLQRLAIEALYTSVETGLNEAQRASTDEIVDLLLASLSEAGLEPGLKTQDMLTAAFDAGLDAASEWRWDADPEVALFDLINALIAAERTSIHAVPMLTMAALRCVQVLATAEQSSEIGADALRDFEREPDRLPIGLMLERLQALSVRPAKEMLREVIEAWVFGQHVRWSIARSGDGKQRLRVALDEGGWTFLRGRLSGVFEPTPDRLLSALRLGAGCGLVQALGNDLWAPA